MVDDLPMTLKCAIGGEEWVANQYKSFLTGVADKQTARTVHFTCPAGHWFSLGEAVKAGMFNEKQKDNIIQYAREQHAKYKKDTFGTLESQPDLAGDVAALKKAGKIPPNPTVPIEKEKEKRKKKGKGNG